MGEFQSTPASRDAGDAGVPAVPLRHQRFNPLPRRVTRETPTTKAGDPMSEVSIHSRVA